MESLALEACHAGKVFSDEERARTRLASVNQLITEVYAACVDLQEVTVTYTAAQTFEAVANALRDTQKALLLFYRHTLDEGAADGAAAQ